MVRGAGEAADFSDLVKSSAVLRSRASAPSLTTTLDGIPRLGRTLQQVTSSTEDVLRRRDDDDVNIKALRMLAQHGFRSDRLRLAVEHVSTRSPFVAGAADHRQGDGDAARMLRLQREAVVCLAADKARLRANACFQASGMAAMRADLAAAKPQLAAAIIDVCGLRAKRAHAQGGGMPLTKSPRRMPSTPRETYRTLRTPRSARGGGLGLAGSPWGAGPPQRRLFAADPVYLEVVENLLVEGDLTSVATMLHSAAVEKGEEQTHFRECLAVLANLASLVRQEVPGSALRAYAARTVLEDQFAELGGVTTVKPRLASANAIRSDVLQFVSRLRETGRLAPLGDSPHMYDDESLWAQVYYCFRIGNIDAAFETVQRAVEDGNTAIANYLRLFNAFMTHREEERERQSEPKTFVGTLRDIGEYHALLEEYRTVVWPSGDTYYRACYFLLARMEAAPPVGESEPFSDAGIPYPLQSPDSPTFIPLQEADYAALFSSVEDFMWMRLFVARNDEEMSQVHDLSLGFLQVDQVPREILACGPRHFDPTETQPLLYAFVLICGGLYKEAVDYLRETAVEVHIANAVHIALSLYLLQWDITDNDYWITLRSYITLIAPTSPEHAVVYLLTLQDREKVSHGIVYLLVENNVDAEKLLGGDDPEMHPGMLREFLKKMPLGFSQFQLDDVALVRRSYIAEIGDVMS